MTAAERAVHVLLTKLDGVDANAECYREGARDVMRCLHVSDEDIEKIVGVMVPESTVSEAVLVMRALEAKERGQS